MKPTQLIDQLDNRYEKTRELELQKREIEGKIEQINENSIKDIFGELTIPQLRDIYNNADEEQRMQILEANPYVVMRLEKLDSHGGWRYGELLSQDISEKWNEGEWLERLDDYFKHFCKPTPDRYCKSCTENGTICDYEECECGCHD